MSFDYKFNITEDLKSGIDLYTQAGIKLAIIPIGVTSSVTASALQQQLASSSTSGDVSASSSGTKIALASSSITIAGASLTLGTEQLFSLISISASSNVSVSGTKIALAQSTPSGSADASGSVKTIAFVASLIYSAADVSVTANKVQYGASQVSISASVSPTATKVRTASISINAISLIVTAGKEILFANISIPVMGTSLIATAIKFAVNNNIDTSSYKTLFVLDDKPLTNQGRTYTSDLNMDFIESKNWNNTKSRYYKRQGLANPTRKSFALSWTYLPNSRYDTVDKRYARDYLKSVASDPDIHTLKMLNNDSDGNDPYTETEYNVFVRDYSETLVRRDLVSNVYFWECSMTLEEA
jgi:hypothetical protein